MSLLKNITSTEDLKKLSIEQLDILSQEIRNYIIKTMSTNGGHLASNLGIVELTLALHYVYNSPEDKFLFDTSHQTYTHKIVTGRYSLFNSIRKFKGISGFLHPKESKHDHFFSGHAGNTLSVALGLAKSIDFSALNDHVISVIGDGSLTCGLIHEALNNIPKDLKNFIVVLNDNKMAISKNVGHVKNILSRLLNNPISNKVYQEITTLLSKVPAYGDLLAEQGKKITESIKHLVSPAPFFEQYGLSYIGPIDGHDIKKMTDTFKALKNLNKPVIVHVLTTKGNGMTAASENPTPYHGVKPFDISSGKFLTSSTKPTFPQIFGKQILKMAKEDSSIVAITPAMLAGSCLGEFKKEFPTRCFDVGIAEGHAITFAGALAYKKKMKVVAVVYSTFLQRAFDNVFHDICLQEAPVVIGIDRGGISGPDGCTHHGIYDIAFLNSMPNMVIAQPRDGYTLKRLVNSAFDWNRPVAIRYPNLRTEEDDLLPTNKIPLGKGEILKTGKDILIIATSHKCSVALEVSHILENNNISSTVVDPIFIKPLDEKLFHSLMKDHKLICTIEEHSLCSGFGSIFNNFLIRNNYSDKTVLNFGIPDEFIQHGSNDLITKEIMLDANSISTKIIKNITLQKKYDYSTIS
jgi:1-deoxy-D-xylulose-5-phosphate synthase